MTLYTNVYGLNYDDSEPCYFSTADGVNVWSIVSKKWINFASLVAKVTAEGHDWQPREVGVPSLMWQIKNTVFNYSWGPGLDDTEALASEIVTNGEVWTGATGTTPPTGWTGGGDDATFTIADALLDIDSAETGDTLTQTLTGTPGSVYVLELAIANRTTGGARVSLDGVGIAIAPGDADGSPTASRMRAFSFVMPASGTVELEFEVAGGTKLALKFCRCYLESELTGAGPTQIGIPPTPPETEVAGPFTTGETTYFVQSFPATGAECLVWFDVDSDPDPDIKLTLQAVCESDVNDEAKMHIHATLQAMNYCTGLPCMTTRGRLQKPYRKGPE